MSEKKIIFIIGSNNSQFLKRYCQERSGVVRVPLNPKEKSYYKFAIEKAPLLLDIGCIPLFEVENADHSYGVIQSLENRYLRKEEDMQLKVHNIVTDNENLIGREGILIKKENVSSKRHLQYIFERVLDLIIINNKTIQQVDLKKDNQYVSIYHSV